VKIYVAAVEALSKKERQGETQKTIKTRVLVLSFPDFTEISNVI
jgi:hypothetical protein